MKTFKQFLKEANESSKYKKGEFGYWWTVEQGNEDIEGKVYNGNIDCLGQKLTSLKGCPKEVTNMFNCSGNKLTSLKYGPEKVGVLYNCADNKLTSLEGAPSEVEYFACNKNNLTSLKYGPEKVKKSYNCRINKLTSLEGAPSEVEYFDCAYNNLTSLKGSLKVVKKEFNCSNNKLTSLEGNIKEVGWIFDDGNKIKSFDNGPKITDSEGFKRGLGQIRMTIRIKNNAGDILDSNLEQITQELSKLKCKVVRVTEWDDNTKMLVIKFNAKDDKDIAKYLDRKFGRKNWKVEN